MRCLRVLVLLCCLPFLLGSNTHQGTTDATSEMRAWFGDAGSGYVVANCVPTTSPTTTITAACQAYVESSTGSLIYVTQASASIGPLLGGDGAYWLAVHKDVATAVGGWTRQSGTHYLWKKSVTQPPMPAESLLIATVTVTGSQVPVVRSMGSRTLIPSVTSHWVSATDYGAVAGDSGDDSQAIINALATGFPVELPCGVLTLAATVPIPPRAMLRGCGQGDDTLAPTLIELTTAIGFTLIGSGGTPQPYGAVLSDFAIVTTAGGSTTGISIARASRIVLERLSFRGEGGGFAQGAIAMDSNGGIGVTDVVIQRSTFTNTAADGIQIGAGVSMVTIAANTFGAITGHGIHGAGLGNASLTIAGNTFGAQTVSNVTLHDVQGFTVRDNRFTSTVPQLVVQTAAGGTMRNGLITNNVFLGNGTNTAITLGASGVSVPTRALIIQGNHFSTLNVAIAFPEASAQGTDTLVSNNVYTSITTAPLSGYPGGGSTLARAGVGFLVKEFGSTAVTTVANTAAATPIFTYTVPGPAVTNDGGLLVHLWGTFLNNTGAGTSTTLTLTHASDIALLCNFTGVGTGTQPRAWEVTVWLSGGTTDIAASRSYGSCLLSGLLGGDGLTAVPSIHLTGQNVSLTGLGLTNLPLTLTVTHASASADLSVTIQNASIFRLPGYE